jgi:hypothetical protein
MYAVIIKTVLCALVLAQAPEGRVETLALPHPLRAGERAWLEIHVGPLSRGARIEVETASGKLLGVISPFGVRSGNEAGTYTVPVPADAISDDRVCIRLLFSFNQSQRAPTLKEVKSVRVTITGADPRQ